MSAPFASAPGPVKPVRSSIDVQTWSVRKIVAAINGDGPEHIFIPSFQRSFVWNYKKQDGLINSIKESKPVGSLLFYDDGIRGGKRQYQIVDGLQRATTLINYEQAVFTSFSVDEIDEEFVSNLLDYLDVASERPAERSLAEKRVKSVCTEWVRKQRSFSARDGFRGSGLLAAVAERFALADAMSNTSAMQLCEDYVETIRDRLEIADYRVPVVVFSGDKSLLPDIFEQLNTTGIKLNKFDILASSWDQQLIPIELPELKKAVKRRMTELGKESIAREVGDSERGKVELFHAVCASGMVLAERAPELFPTKKKWKPSEPLSHAFNVTALTFSVPLSEMDEIPDRLRRFESPDAYFAEVFAAADEVNRALHPTIGGNFADSRLTQTHTELQMASIVATIFRARAKHSDGQFISEVERAKMLRQHYLWDAIRREWSGTGDTKAVRVVVQDRYMTPVTRQTFMTAARAWHEEHMESIRHSKASWIDISALAFLRAYLFASGVVIKPGAAPLTTEPVLPYISILTGKPSLISNIRILDDRGRVLCDPSSSIPPPPASPTTHDLREFLSNRFNAMLDKIVLSYGFPHQT